MRLFSTTLAASVLLCLSSAAPLSAAAPDFHADVAPILRDYCSSCHSGKEVEGELSLETYQALKKGGENGSPLPKKSGDSSLLQKVLHGGKPAMPPKKEPQPTPADLAVLEQWLKAGAPGPTAPDVSILTLVTVPDLPLVISPSRALTAATASLDGRLLATAKYRSVEIVDAATKKTLHRFDGLPGKVTSLAFNKDGTRLAAASGVAGISGTVLVWTLEDHSTPLKLEQEHHDLVYCVKWSPDETLIASAGYDKKVVLWDPTQGKPARTLEGHNGAVFDVAFHPDGGLIATASADQTVKIWSLRDGERLDTLKEPQGEQFSVAFTPDGKGILAAGADRRIRLWNLKSRDKAEINPILESRFAHEATINALAILPGGTRLVSSAIDRSLKVWGLPSLDLQEVIPAQSDTLTALHALNVKDRIVVARMDGSLETIQLPKPPATTLQTPETKSSTPPPPLTTPAEIPSVVELEPNNKPSQSQPVHLPVEIKGAIQAAGDVDSYRFSAKKGEQWTFEVFAEREKSTLDSRLEVCDEQGRPIERVTLQATRSSWLTFRGKDSTASGDFRLQNYAEMELNEFLYCNGEVLKLWLAPRGIDSGFIVYPGQGKRQTYFDTTPIAHPLGQPAYIVQPLPPGTNPPPNGLPIFKVHYENDDDSSRTAGHDSVLHFTAPADAVYQLRVSDSRGLGASTASYRVLCRPTLPDFKISISAGSDPNVSPGSGREFQVKAERIDGFDGEIRVNLEDLPPGFSATTPLVIERGQSFAQGVIYAEAGITKPTPEVSARTTLSALATISGREVKRTAKGLGAIKVGPPAKLTVHILANDPKSNSSGQPLELELHPGETITAKIRANRIDFKDRVEFGTEDAGRNFPHGVYVDNIGLNGLLIPEEQTEREFFLTAAKWVPESRRLIHFRTKGDGGQTTQAVWLNIKRPL